ncbi:unnamed protein product [Lactuca virosa]|uniref:DUF3444 domain-containing protein n=1 Tax=Lactuca virosa TaxID=75947 RepID=A0AAU9MM61_9ASTR|nr:unnamed protein product [Lactuca virosa]
MILSDKRECTTQFAGQNISDVPSSHFSGVNPHQQPPPDSSIRASFGTYCPFCNIKYEYDREFVNRPLRCQHCSKLFIAYDITAQGAAPEVPGSRADVYKEAAGSMPNGNHVNLDDDSKFVNCLDLEFSNFDKDKEEDRFAVDQIWACYDSVDGMPRFYAKIRKVFTRNFKLKITWLEADPNDESEIKWAEEGLPVGCGKFVGGKSEETKDRLMYSHQIVYKNGLKRNSFVIYPQKGEIWALFKDWDIKWGSDPENHTKFKFDIVEILDVHVNGSVSVALLVKVKGFVSLFKKTAWGGLNDRKIPGNEHLRFSHRIPSTKLTGAERAGVPPGSFELDTASLPDDLEDYYYSINPAVLKGLPFEWV